MYAAIAYNTYYMVKDARENQAASEVEAVKTEKKRFSFMAFIKKAVPVPQATQTL
ncbi:hypothetical protein [Vibrio japonicus]|uniref:Uncharacterized protein n=1 Tax=Vibrio japonicus TaxID=1824638 RepID=A0ABY5LI59_9VIBR|nr:hypothetical protein [Vibrio japonicus]UUM31727.1 hypothetical protein NP165_06225 [Vibrio japonicus]